MIKYNVNHRRLIMGMLGKLETIYEDAVRARCMRSFAAPFTGDSPADPARDGNLLGFGDNAAFMDWLLAEKGMAGVIDFIYADPPFFSKADYEAYSDIWKGGLEEFLSMLTLRLILMRELLSEKGTIAVHLDHHAAHYVKVLMDELFGAENFVNEIIWSYKSGGAGRKSFAKKHDNILLFSKSRDYYFDIQKEKSYNRGGRPYRFKGIEEFCDEKGWYTLVNRKDVLSVNMVGRTAAERTGYPTQKPLELLSILLASCSEENALCADFFCGSGTLPIAAGRAGRRFIACDIGKTAIVTTSARLKENGISFTLLTCNQVDDSL